MPGRPLTRQLDELHAHAPNDWDPPTDRRDTPETYRPELIAELITLARNGWTPAEIANHWAVAVEELLTWRDAHPAFEAALARARDAAQAWWETKARVAMATRDNKFPAGAWAMVMRARFAEYREKVEVQHTIDITKRLVILDLREGQRAGPLSEQSVEGAKPLIEHGPARLVASQTGESGTQLDLTGSRDGQAAGSDVDGSGPGE